MDFIIVFFTAFWLVLVGELGDKTQIAACTGALANRKDTFIIFLSSALALLAVAALTVFFAGLIPESWLPKVELFGGLALFGYGIYLYRQAGIPEAEEAKDEGHGLVLFVSHFLVVFIAEMGDKTQFATLGVSIENPEHLAVVFAGSATALVTVTAATVWGVTKVPTSWIKRVQQVGAVLMSIYGLYMIAF